jgi:hypothetical protein
VFRGIGQRRASACAQGAAVDNGATRAPGTGASTTVGNGVLWWPRNGSCARNPVVASMSVPCSSGALNPMVASASVPCSSGARSPVMASTSRSTWQASSGEASRSRSGGRRVWCLT